MLSVCCEFDEDVMDGGEVDEDGLIEVDVMIDVDWGMIEGVCELMSMRMRMVGEEETVDYAESDEDEDGRRGF